MFRAMFYKMFPRPRTALRVSFLWLVGALVMAAPALAAPELYNVSNINVDVTAENALKAREEAFVQAQVKAFEELAGRILPEERFSSYTAPSADIISRLIQDYEVSDEKLAAKRYIGTYVFRFRRSAVDKYLGITGAPAMQAAPYAAYPQNGMVPPSAPGAAPANAPYASQQTPTATPPGYPYAPAPTANAGVQPPMSVQPQPSGRAQAYAVRVRFGSLSEWTKIQRALANVYGMQDIALKALSPREAYLDLGYRGDVKSFQTALGQAGLSLIRAEQSSLYDISLLASGSGANAAAYQTKF